MTVRLVVQTVLWLFSLALVLFLAAGDPSWSAAWAFLMEMGILSLAVGFWLAWRDPALLAERMTAPWQKSQPSWDRTFTIGLFMGFYVWLAVMAIDSQRLRLSAVPQPLHGVGLLAIAGAVCIAWMTFMANRYAAPSVKIQADQTVSEQGPYALVRHPMYGGAIGFFVGVPLMLGSWVGLAIAPLFIAAMGWRALREERLLRQELPGYEDYAARVRYRFVPGVW